MTTGQVEQTEHLHLTSGLIRNDDSSRFLSPEHGSQGPAAGVHDKNLDDQGSATAYRSGSRLHPRHLWICPTSAHKLPAQTPRLSMLVASHTVPSWAMIMAPERPRRNSGVWRKLGIADQEILLADLAVAD